MKNKFLLIMTGMLSLLISSQVMSEEANLNALKKEAVGIVEKFAGTLQPQLKKALQSGGPVQAIEICSQKAPEIARKLSAESGWSIKRVSLKARNNKTAIPDKWERKILMQFDERQAKGEPARKIAHAEIVDGRFRFMKAQGVRLVCMNCHARNIKPPVEAALKLHYPDDKARGYSLGQIRGAFSLSKDL